MDVKNPNTLTFVMQITNATDTTFWLDDESAKHPAVIRHEKILPYQTVFLTFEGDPHLKQDSDIDYDIKKEVFSTFARYTNYKQTARFETSLDYCHRKAAGNRIPKVEFFWKADAHSVGTDPVTCGAVLQTENNVYPYSYSMTCFITVAS
jgi:hypothetical protein